MADPHWRPIWQHCNMCQMNYDYILKLENLASEEADFFDILDPDHKLQLEQENLHNNHNRLNLTSGEITKLYLQQLNEKEVSALYELYKLDFQLFDYSPNEVI